MHVLKIFGHSVDWLA